MSIIHGTCPYASHKPNRRAKSQIDVQKVSSRGKTSGEDDVTFARRLVLAPGVGAVPGFSFWRPGAEAPPYVNRDTSRRGFAGA